MKSKTKTAAWFVSNCLADSNRGALTKKLQEFIDIDIYGNCGNLSCPKDSDKDCNDMLSSTYKFYFSFENILCVDYVTEKVFRTMSLNVIPVVYSGADMSRFLPPKSYINANDFTTAKDLANHLKYLAETPEEYVKYFWWRNHYKISRGDSLGSALCQLCMKLNEHNLASKRQVYVNMWHWYSKNSCKNPKIKF